MQLDFFALLDAPRPAATLPPPVENRPLRQAKPPQAHQPGSYVIRSESERGYWSNEHGWVYDVATATPYGPEHVCPAIVVQWRRDGHPIMSPRGHWMWIAQRGGLAGYRGADWDGPYETDDKARAGAIAALGTDKPLMSQRDAEYVLAAMAEDYQLD
jgi:hypothetical protein